MNGKKAVDPTREAIHNELEQTRAAYDNFLIIVSFVFNGLTVWYA